MDVSAFDYELPANAIAQEAIEPRDAARLLVVDGLVDRGFRDFPELLQSGDLVVVNNTRVRPARIHATKPTGGSVELLLTKRISESEWEALVRPARRIRPGTAMTAGPLTMIVVTEPDRGVVTLAIDAPRDVDEILESLGEVPLPPYFSGTLEDDERYQTIFAAQVGSAAAPTAALHFTSDVLGDLEAKGVNLATVELEVGLDTFRPMSDGAISDHPMHRERYTVSEHTSEAIHATRERGGRVVAVGTTVVRTLETVARSDGTVLAGSGTTDLFIDPGYRPKVIDAMLTNFHAPRTTLIVMIAALIGSAWREAYAHALASGYRFLSFGDAMFIEVER